MAVPIASKSAEAVMERNIYLYLQLKADGSPVRQLHTDRDENLRRRIWSDGARTGHLQDHYVGDSPQQNGRAETCCTGSEGRGLGLFYSSRMGS